MNLTLENRIRAFTKIISNLLKELLQI